MKSSLKNMTLVLFTITLLVSAAVGGVNMITAEPIAKAEESAKQEALKVVLPPFDATTQQVLTIDQLPITVYTATESGQVVGYAVETMTKRGFGGEISMMVGFKPDGQVINVNVLQQAETPGLGTKMTDKNNVLLGSVQGKVLDSMKLVDGKLAVKKDGGDVDALTAATISSRAYVDAINRAWMAYRSVATGTAPTDVSSGASNTAVKTQATSGDSTSGASATQHATTDGASGASATQSTSTDATSTTSAADGASGASATQSTAADNASSDADSNSGASDNQTTANGSATQKGGTK